jgi:hypothetical protein
MPESLLKEEYARLTTEIGRNVDSFMKLIVTAVIFVSALIGFAIQQANGYLFLTSFALLVPCQLILAAIQHNINRIATYIIVFIEGEASGIHWESRLIKLPGDSFISNGARMKTGVISVMIALETGSLVLSYLFIKQLDLRYYLTVGVAVGLSIWGIVVYLKSSSDELKKNYMKTWEDEKRKEAEVMPEPEVVKATA